MSWIDPFYCMLTVPFLRVQQSGLGFDVFESSPVDSQLIIYFLFIFLVLVLVLIYGVHEYNRWRKFNKFALEVETFDLDPDSKGTFTSMVKRCKLNEPINILLSSRLFDEMAAQEMTRILSSDGSKRGKEHLIDTIYEIRAKIFTPELVSKA